VNGFAAKNDNHARETGQCDRNLRSNTKSFARFHVSVLFLSWQEEQISLPSFCVA
jgi:hypothetical protein